MPDLKQYIIKDSIDKNTMIKMVRKYNKNRLERLLNIQYINIKQKYKINIKNIAKNI